MLRPVPVVACGCRPAPGRVRTADLGQIILLPQNPFLRTRQKWGCVGVEVLGNQTRGFDMPTKGHAEEQIIATLKQRESGKSCMPGPANCFLQR